MRRLEAKMKKWWQKGRVGSKMYAQGKKGRVEAQQEGMERKKERLVARRMGCWHIFKQTPIDPC